MQVAGAKTEGICHPDTPEGAVHMARRSDEGMQRSTPQGVHGEAAIVGGGGAIHLWPSLVSV